MKTRHVLICAPRLPEYDREGGSRRIFHFIEFCIRSGWAVSLAAEDGTDSERYARTLQQMGVATYVLAKPWTGGLDALIDFNQLIRDVKFDLILIAHWYCAETYTTSIRMLSPATTVVVDSIDIHFLRQSRGAFTNADRSGGLAVLDESYGNEMMREVNAYAAADAVLTVSEKEARLVNDLVGRPIALAMPDMEDAEISPLPFEKRKGMLFVGNFRHPPNVQAVEYLCREILPGVPRSVRAAHPLEIVGNDPTQAVVDCCDDTDYVRLVGWVPSVLPYLQQARISLIPLLYGAGTKRKLMQSLMVGTPSVSTRIGVEGLDLVHDVHVLVGEDAAGFAASIQRLVENAALWQRLERQGRDFVLGVHGREVVYARWNDVIGAILNNHGGG